MRETTILIIEDNATMAELASTVFEQIEANTHIAFSGEEGLKAFYDLKPDLVMIDIGLPNMNGWQLCERIREISAVPIIIVTGKDDPPSIIRGLELGADDYICKPYTPGILLARAKAALRRGPQSTTTTNVAAITLDRYEDQHLLIDINTMQVQVKGQAVKLSQTEWRLVTYLVQNSDQILPTTQILDQVWGQEYHNDTQYVYTYIHRLRQKLEVDPNVPQYLISEHGIGFRFCRSDPLNS